ncbi:caspase family protein [Microvirga terrae]|uniref:Caspase family protein n=1 Tax=Microvirga terrae TaxID=2740529 RepID=A0ABY5RSR6_9HYPH|nr:caspase family protein [Microvirga terrae]UVF18832.1 caspase family protein [Microvirga terrae]
MRATDPSSFEHTLYSQSHALLIGQFDYENWKDLPAVRQEVLELRDALEKHRFKVEVHFNLKAEQFVDVVEHFMRKHATVPESRILVYVSGHGWRRNISPRPAGYIVPIDAPPENGDRQALTASGIAMPLFAAWARAPDPRHMLFVFDACFSGTFFGQPDPQPAPAPRPPRPGMAPTPAPITPLYSPPPEARGPEVDDYIFQPVPRGLGRQFITAGSHLELAPADSVFSRLFIDILSGRRPAGDNFDHWLTGAEIGHYLRLNTRREYKGKENPTTPMYGPLRDEIFEGGDFVFVRPDVSATPLVREEPDEFEQAIAKRERERSSEKFAADAADAIAAAQVARLESQTQLAEAAAALQKAASAAQDVRSIPASPINDARRQQREREARQYSAQAAEARTQADAAQQRVQTTLARAEGLKNAALSSAAAEVSRSQSVPNVPAPSAEALAASERKVVEDLAATIDQATTRVAAVAPVLNEQRLSSAEEAKFQSLINTLSSDNTPVRRQAREELAQELNKLPASKRDTTIVRLSQDLARKSYRYQIGLAVALTKQPQAPSAPESDLIREELNRAAQSSRDRTLSLRLSEALAKLRPSP